MPIDVLGERWKKRERLHPIWRLRILIKSLWSPIAHWLEVIEFCERCGRKQPLVWEADDALWKEVNGTRNGCLCPECFDVLAERVGYQVILWIPTQDPAFLRRQELLKKEDQPYEYN